MDMKDFWQCLLESTGIIFLSLSSHEMIFSVIDYNKKTHIVFHIFINIKKGLLASKFFNAFTIFYCYLQVNKFSIRNLQAVFLDFFYVNLNLIFM